MSIAILSDPHGNAIALRAVLEDIRQHGCERLFVLGDVINGIDSQGCLDLLKGWSTGLPTGWPAVTYVRGNAEAYTLTPNLDALPRADEPMNRSLVPLIRWFQAHISASDLAWMQTWPDRFVADGIYMVHDSPLGRFFPETWRDPTLPDEYQEWFYHGPGIGPHLSETELTELFTWMAAQNFTHVFCGHTHEPVLYARENRVICNVGSAGMPLGGDPRACWVEWQPEITGEAGLAFHRVEYDIQRTLQMISDDPTFHANDSYAQRQAYKKMIATAIHWKEHLHEFTTD
jgi:predicted phosphodiesterase